MIDTLETRESRRDRGRDPDPGVLGHDEDRIQDLQLEGRIPGLETGDETGRPSIRRGEEIIMTGTGNPDPNPGSPPGGPPPGTPDPNSEVLSMTRGEFHSRLNHELGRLKLQWIEEGKGQISPELQALQTKVEEYENRDKSETEKTRDELEKLRTRVESQTTDLVNARWEAAVQGELGKSYRQGTVVLPQFIPRERISLSGTETPDELRQKAAVAISEAFEVQTQELRNLGVGSPGQPPTAGPGVSPPPGSIPPPGPDGVIRIPVPGTVPGPPGGGVPSPGPPGAPPGGEDAFSQSARLFRGLADQRVKRGS